MLNFYPDPSSLEGAGLLLGVPALVWAEQSTCASVLQKETCAFTDVHPLKEGSIIAGLLVGVLR